MYEKNHFDMVARNLTEKNNLHVDHGLDQNRTIRDCTSNASLTETMPTYSNIKKIFDQLITKNDLKIIFLLRFTMVIPFTLRKYTTNTFSNTASSTITHIISINMSSHNTVSIISSKIINILFHVH